jgi:hypothetical protein
LLIARLIPDNPSFQELLKKSFSVIAESAMKPFLFSWQVCYASPGHPSALPQDKEHPRLYRGQNPAKQNGRA